MLQNVAGDCSQFPALALRRWPMQPLILGGSGQPPT
jgi:hypothetical protein